MKNIIIPVDFSKYSEYALKTAATLAKRHSFNLLLVHMLELPNGYSQYKNDFGKSTVFLIKYAEKKMKSFLEKEYLEGIKTTVIIKHFMVFHELGKLAEEYDASLIVMGSHGASENGEGNFLGSNTEKVIRSSNIPVLIIKDELPEVDFSKSVFVSDFKLESIQAYQKAQEFYKVIGVKPTLLFINKPDSNFVSTAEMKIRFEKFLMEADGSLENLSCFANYDDYRVVDGVKYFADENNISLISIATHGKSDLSLFFNYSISFDIAHKFVRPVLTVLIE